MPRLLMTSNALQADNVAPFIDWSMLTTTLILNVFMLALWEGDLNSFETPNPLKGIPKDPLLKKPNTGWSTDTASLIEFEGVFWAFGTIHLIFCAWIVMHHIMTLRTEQIGNLLYKVTLLLLSLFSIAARNKFPWSPYLYGERAHRSTFPEHARGYCWVVLCLPPQLVGAMCSRGCRLPSFHLC